VPSFLRPRPRFFRLSCGSLVAAVVGLLACNGGRNDPLGEKGTGKAGAAGAANKRPIPSSTWSSWSPAPPASLQNLVTSSPTDLRVAAGARSYARYCALCHGNDAKGYAADHAPSLVTTTFLESASDDFLTRSIRGGRPGTAMAGYGRDRGGPMSEEEISALIAFLRAQGPKPDDAIASASVAKGNAAQGQTTYDASCKRCHGTPEFRGDVVHLGNPAFLATATDGFLRHAIVKGRPGTPMVPFEGVLDDGQINDVVALLRSWGPAVPPVATAVVAPPLKAPEVLGPIVINPNGRAPTFTLREERFVPIDQVKKALDGKQKVIIVDARAASDWLVMHIPGSLPMPYYELKSLDALPNDGTWVLAYCACPHHASGVVIDELRKRGFKHTAILDEGILEWDKRKYPVVRQGATGPSAVAPSASSALPTPVPRPTK
jgi:mono/diheme cytochrome c family protein/rhodanese-related sulfurtransferase